jgi:predicted nucleic acid-binding protein
MQLKGVEISQADLYFALVVAPVEVYNQDFYKDKLELAEHRIGKRDIDDVDLLALALKLSIPIWTNDKDYNVAGVKTYTTAQLLNKLRL